jgi:hypothetical protein
MKNENGGMNWETAPEKENEKQMNPVGVTYL